MKPIIKWAGGKSWAEQKIKTLITPEMLANGTYIEPFCGGAAIALSLEPSRLVLGDLNAELINLYQVIATKSDELVDTLINMQKQHCPEYFYSIRSQDRDPNFSCLDPVIRAARFMYLNRTCFNGLYRVNSKGYFNTPIGRSSSGKAIDIVQADKINELATYFKDTRNSINFVCANYLDITASAEPGDIIVLDPPYAQTNHTSYQKEGFTWQDTEKLKLECDRLHTLGCHLVIFNEGTQEIKELFSEYEIGEISVKRTISCKGENRSAPEVLITNII